MNVSKIIDELYRSDDVARMLSAALAKHEQRRYDIEDLMQWCFVKLLEMPSQDIIDMHSRNELRFYFARLFYFQLNKNNSEHNKMLRGHNTTLEVNFVDLNEKICNSKMIQQATTETILLNETLSNSIDEELLFNEKDVEIALTKIDPIAAACFRVYIEFGTYEKAALVGGVNHSFMYRAVQRAVKEIKQLLYDKEKQIRIAGLPC